MSSTQVPGTVSGFFSDVRRWERTDHRLTWSDGLLVAYCALFWFVAVQGMIDHLLHDSSPASSALVYGITGITAWAALPPLQLITPWPAARRTLRAAVSILSIGAGAASLGLLHGIGLTTQPTALWDHLLSATLPATALIFLGVSGIATLLRTAAAPGCRRPGRAPAGHRRGGGPYRSSPSTTMH